MSETKLPRGRILRWESLGSHGNSRLPEVVLSTTNGLDVYVLRFTSAAEALELANTLRGAAGGLRRRKQR